MSRGIVVEVPVDAPAQVVWDGLTDWEGQSEWVLGTRVRAMTQDGRGVGASIEAITGVGPLGVPDTLVVEVWDPPRRCRVRHLRYLVRGPAGFEVVPVGDDRSRIVWWEELVPPFGPVGRLGWPLVERVLALGFRRSLRTFAALTAARHTAASA